MEAFLLFLAAFCIFHSAAILLEDTLPSTAADLYHLAAQAIESQEFDRAMLALEALIERYPASPLSLLAIVRLAELQIASGNRLDAIEWIRKWSRCRSGPGSLECRNLDDESLEEFAGLGEGESRSSEVLSSSGDSFSAPLRIRQLLITALDRLTDAEWKTFLERQPIERNPETPRTWSDAAILRESIRRSIRTGDLEFAWSQMRLLGDRLSNEERELRDYRLPLAILRQTESEAAIQAIQQWLSLGEDQTMDRFFAINLSVAEAYRRLGKPLSSLETLGVLSAVLSNSPSATSPQAAEGQDASPAALPSREDLENWRAIVRLRQAELNLELGDRQSALALLNRPTEHPLESSLGREFGFLSARCWIAEVEFDRAIEQLQGILNESPQDSEHAARALWMLGEIEFLMRRFEAAVEYYGRCAAMASHPRWQARSWLQMAKCYELLRRPSEAVDAYRRVVREFPQSDVRAAAQQRLGILLSGRLAASAASSDESK